MSDVSQKPIAWIVHNRITGKDTKYASRNRAHTASDKADNAYGSYITSIQPVWE